MIQTLFEDPDILGVAKPEGLATIPERGSKEGCLVAQLAREYGRLYVVHRLDKETSGVILFAKNAAAHRHLNDQFAGRDVHKTYLAITHGVIASDGGVIDLPIRQFGSGRMGIDPERGKASATEYSLVERLNGFTIVQACPRTGRRHQVRVHLYGIGHPIVGDLRYGDQGLQIRFSRLMLHALSITFRLPSRERVTVRSPVPPSFETVLAEIRELSGCSW